MNDERLRQLYMQGLTAREAKHSRAGAPCAVSPDDLLALARGELPEERRLELLDQVMVSARCRQELDLLRAVVAAEREAVERESLVGESSDAPAESTGPPALRLVRGGAARVAEAAPRRAWWRGPGITAAIAATLLVAVGIGQIARTRNRASEAEEVTRGAGNGVTVVSPGDAVESGAPVAFVWRATPGATRYALDLSDAGGTAVYETTTRDTTVALPATVALRPGTEYRWIVRATDDAGSPRGETVRRLAVRAR